MPSHINLEYIRNSGQCFRCNIVDDHYHIDIGTDKYINVNFLNHLTTNLNKEQIYHYFNLYQNYNDILRSIAVDDWTKECVDNYNGLILLNQEPIETIFSYILSQNNTVKNVSNCIDKIIYVIYESINISNILDENLLIKYFEINKCGYRSKYITEAIKYIRTNKNIFDFKDYITLDNDMLRAKLTDIHGIGRKVADCIMLYSMQKYDIVPADTWIIKAYHKLTQNTNFPKSKFHDIIQSYYIDKYGNYAGYAQLFHFYDLRNNRNINSGN